MTRTLMLHDRIAPPANPSAYFEVLDPQLHAGCIKVFDASARADKYLEASKVLADLHIGKLALSRENKPRFSLAAQSKLSEQCMTRIDFVRSVMSRVHDIEVLHGLSFLKAYQRAKQEHLEAAPTDSTAFPSQAAIYRYRQCERSGLPSLRGDKNKGNRVPRHSEEVRNAIEKTARDHYLVEKSRWNLDRVTEHVNRTLPQGESPLSIRYVSKFIREEVSSDPDKDRMLADDAIAGKSIAKKRIRAESPFERVEQDAVHMPFVVKTPSGVTSNIYLIHAIDCCTGYPLGWKFVIGAPTESDSLDCIEMYMSPAKAQRFKELGIKHTINACGTPGLIVLDNGAETKGRRLENLKLLGPETKHCRSNEAQGKAFVERLNLSLKTALEGLGGCTRFNGQDGMRDPIALGDRLMTLEELEVWVVRWYYEKWVNMPLKRLRWDVVLVSSVKGTTPAARWKHYEDSCFAISLPPSRSEWLAALYKHAERKLSRKTGITLDSLVFKGDAIPQLIAKYGEHRSVHVLYNPDDFRHIYVFEGDDFPLITLEYEHLRPETGAWTFDEAKERFGLVKSEFAQAPEAKQFDDDFHARVVDDSFAQKKPPKRRSKHARNRETRARDREARAVELASKNPIPVAPPSGTKTKSKGAVAAQSLPALVGLGDAPLLPVLNRNNGANLK